MLGSADNQSKIDFYKKRIMERIDSVKDYMSNTKYRLYKSMVENCNDYNELLDMAEIDLQVTMFKYIQDLQSKLENYGTNVSELSTIKNNVRTNQMVIISSKKKEKSGNMVDLSLEDINELMNDDDATAAMAMALSYQLSTQPLCEKYHDEIIDSSRIKEDNTDEVSIYDLDKLDTSSLEESLFIEDDEDAEDGMFDSMDDMLDGLEFDEDNIDEDEDNIDEDEDDIDIDDYSHLFSDDNEFEIDDSSDEDDGFEFEDDLDNSLFFEDIDSRRKTLKEVALDEDDDDDDDDIIDLDSSYKDNKEEYIDDLDDDALETMIFSDDEEQNQDDIDDIDDIDDMDLVNSLFVDDEDDSDTDDFDIDENDLVFEDEDALEEYDGIDETEEDDEVDYDGIIFDDDQDTDDNYSDDEDELFDDNYDDIVFDDSEDESDDNSDDLDIDTLDVNSLFDDEEDDLESEVEDDEDDEFDVFDIDESELFGDDTEDNRDKQVDDEDYSKLFNTSNSSNNTPVKRENSVDKIFINGTDRGKQSQDMFNMLNKTFNTSSKLFKGIAKKTSNYINTSDMYNLNRRR